jgi:hypothetical protein
MFVEQAGADRRENHAERSQESGLRCRVETWVEVQKPMQVPQARATGLKKRLGIVYF